MKLINNVDTRLGDDLRDHIRKGSRLSIAAASFSLYAFDALRKELEKVESLRFLFTTPTFVPDTGHIASSALPDLHRGGDLCGGEFELRLRNQLTQRAIARECARWVQEKGAFKTNIRPKQPINGLICVQNPRPEEEVVYQNITGFTTADLGLTHRSGFPVLIQRSGFPDSQAFLGWFDQVWGMQEELVDITGQVQAFFERAYAENSPEFIYFITLYNIFHDFLNDLSSGSLPNEQIGFKDTLIWQKLYNFQQDAVVGAINKLEKYKGCILADSVGLGKTFSALGVIKYYEMRNKDVLVLCPKKLEANWNAYRHNDKHNILASDRFRYDVLFHTDLSRASGQSNGRNLESVNWGNYGLVVIDESHNFRNNNPNAGKENRYKTLLRKVIQEGIETKVLMLSATPVNNRFNDLKNQLALAYEGDPANIDPKLDTDKSIDQVFRRAQQAFNTWTRFDSTQRTTERLLSMLDFDFFEILDSLTIARSRKHITTYYDTTAIGQFPQRNKPDSIESPLTEGKKITYVYIADKLILLNLSIYVPLSYVLPSRMAQYADRYDITLKSGKFTQIDRERSLQVLMQINLLKRLESSVDSFRITLEGMIEQIESAIKAIVDNSPEFNGTHLSPGDENLDWEADWGDEESIIGKKIKVHVADMDTRRWKEDLEADLQILSHLWNEVVDIRGKHDRKLQHLIEKIRQKVSEPINEGNKKIIIFTAFADTAHYLYDSLKDLVKDSFGLHTAMITGTKRESNVKGLKPDLNVLLSCFSPLSKAKAQLFPGIDASIDLLIATDCISEGQNLQDCDYLVNYDIHWNPVRIIQRFGRIDRIGSRNKSITMVNFWPDVTLDAYINLKQRVENRMLISNMASTGDDNILNVDEKDLEYRKIQLEKLRDEVIDLEDLREGISITDLGLNDFRVDLSAYMHANGAPDAVPEGLHAVVEATPLLPAGAVFVLKNVRTRADATRINRLHPFYLVYMKHSGEVFLGHVDAKKTLDAMRMLCKGKAAPLLDLCQAVSAETDDYRDMKAYVTLLKRSIGSILHIEEEKEIFSLFKAGGTAALGEKLKGIEDFAVISFLIIK